MYAAACNFLLKSEGDVQRRRTLKSETMSILLEEIDAADSQERLYKVGFLAPNLARRFLHMGVKVLVTEGPRVVASGIIENVYEEGH